MKRWLLISLFIFFFFDVPKEAADGQTLQQLIDAAPAHGTIRLTGQTYIGDIVIDKPLTIIGTKGTVIQGSGRGNVISIKAPHVTITHVTVTNSGKSRSTQEEYAGIKVYSDYNTLEHITVKQSFHGIYLSQAHHNRIANVRVIGEQNGEIAGQGNGLHIYYSNFNELEHNTIIGTRDGIFFDYANHNVAKGNEVSHTRYGLHYMYSDDNAFDDNTFMLNNGGAAIMNSNRIVLKNNRFFFNKGMRSFGLLLQMANDNRIIGNTFYQNERGLYIDQSNDNFLQRNVFLQNEIGIELWSSSQRQTFTENRIWKNTIAVARLGGGDRNRWDFRGVGNDWGGEAALLDLNQDGKGDSPFRYASSFHKLAEENELAYLFLSSPSLGVYEAINEWRQTDEVMAVDHAPLVKKTISAGWWWGLLGFGAIAVIVPKRRIRR
ncbi:nitrous oxide reductase family maturation protein NosD [Geobacillus stearothermophilus]|uniref:nitrous oxide reductase family maturation protein NosD n=1 Tax=Geobacillus stearothermophilus TaxID=1422 RepID=UPI002E23B5DE|nr:nitrous oxide reductase family maturation protein NosD [Geobacillus stearothermophilus]